MQGTEKEPIVRFACYRVETGDPSAVKKLHWSRKGCAMNKKAGVCSNISTSFQVKNPGITRTTGT